MGSKAKYFCYPSSIPHMELWKKLALFSHATDSEECWLLGCPGLLSGSRRDLVAFDLQSWKQPWNAPAPEKMPKWNLFQEHAFPEEYSGLK